jgi:hypothetical protein
VEPQVVVSLLGPLRAWLEGGGDAWEADRAYWQRRRELLDAGVSFDGPGAEELSKIDTAMAVFNPSIDRDPDQIDEARLREELGQALNALRSKGVPI